MFVCFQALKFSLLLFLADRFVPGLCKRESPIALRIAWDLHIMLVLVHFKSLLGVVVFQQAD